MKECEEIHKLYKQLTKSAINYFPKKGVKIDVSKQQGVYIISPALPVFNAGKCCC